MNAYCRCGHIEEDHDPDDGCGACAMAMRWPCRDFRPSEALSGAITRTSHIVPPSAEEVRIAVGDPFAGERKRPWFATTCEVCEGSGERENDLKRIVPCWYCKGAGWYEAAT